MGFFNKYPYTNEHELNLDWIIAKINALKDRVKGVEDAIHDIVVETPNDGKLTIKRNNTIVGDFTANQATDEDINIVVPENTSDLNNDSGFITLSDIPAQVQSNWTEADNTSPAYIQNKPTIPAAQIQSDWTQADNTKVDFIKNKPTIPAAQVNSDWNAISGVAEILNKPTIPAVNDATLTIQKNGTTIDTFTANASSNVTANITCEDKINWISSGGWLYYKDSDGYYHMYLRNDSYSYNFNGSIGNLYYGTSPDYWNFPITVNTVYYVNISVGCSTDIVGATLHSILPTRLRNWFWAAQSGTKTLSVDIHLIIK